MIAEIQSGGPCISCVMNGKKHFDILKSSENNSLEKNKMQIYLYTLYLLSDTGEKEKAARKNISYVITYVPFLGTTGYFQCSEMSGVRSFDNGCTEIAV